MAQRTPPKQILEYINCISTTYSTLKKVYIFGSFVKGTSSKDSDIDIALIFDDIEDVFELQGQLMKMRRQYDTRIEPHVFRFSDFDKTYPLANEILSTGMEVAA